MVEDLLLSGHPGGYQTGEGDARDVPRMRGEKREAPGRDAVRPAGVARPASRTRAGTSQGYRSRSRGRRNAIATALERRGYHLGSSEARATAGRRTNAFWFGALLGRLPFARRASGNPAAAPNVISDCH
jgi:hypothetical protein